MKSRAHQSFERYAKKKKRSKKARPRTSNPQTAGSALNTYTCSSRPTRTSLGSLSILSPVLVTRRSPVREEREYTKA